MDKSSVEPVRQFNRLNQSLVESEIDFGRTVHFIAEIDLTEIERVRDRGRSAALRPTYTAFVAKAVALALLEFPYANRRLFRPLWLPFLSYFQSFRGTDIAVAIERNIEGQAAVAYIEVLRDVHRQTLEELSEQLRAFSSTDVTNSAAVARLLAPGHLVPAADRFAHRPSAPPLPEDVAERYRGGAVLISSPAKYGVHGVVAAWTHPLGVTFGLAQKKPIVRNDEVVAAMAFTFAMNWDRRVMAGAQAARFFARICELLQHPDELTAVARPRPRIDRVDLTAAQRERSRRTRTDAAGDAFLVHIQQ